MLFKKRKNTFWAQALACAVLVVLGAPALTGCDLARNQLKHDRDRNAEFQDARDALAPRLPEVDKKEGANSSIPELQPYVASSSKAVKSMPLVSVDLNQNIPLRDALYELARKANYDVELDPAISGSIIFSARDRPFDEVIARIADIAGLRYKFQDDILRLEVDTPYNKLYKLDFLNYVRTNKGKISNNINVVSGEKADTGSEFTSSSASESDIWGEVEQNLNQILGGAVSGALKTKKTPKITVAESNPTSEVTTPTPATGEGGDKEKGSGQKKAAPPSAAPAVLNVETLPTDEEGDTAGNAPAGADSNKNGYTFTINKQAGLLNVYASEKTQREIASYLLQLRKAVASQVLIEAKVLEVTLDDKHATGIDWRTLGLGNFDINYLTASGATRIAGKGITSYSIPNEMGGISADEKSALAFGFGSDNIEGLIRAVSAYGTVKALASPRLTVLNNQAAVLNVATNHVYFDVDINITTSTENGRSVDISSDVKQVPEGVLVNVQPSIDVDNGTVSMAIRPTVTRVVDSKPDPAVAYVTATADPPITGVESLVPELNVQELDSVIQVRSGQAIVMGGLLQDRVQTANEGIPVLSETPLVGSLFKQSRDRIHKTELVIFLKATILPTPNDTVQDADKDLYRTFSGDRRPFDL